MSFKVGDRVRLVRVPDGKYWDPEWGIVGDVATVVGLDDHSVQVDTGYFWNLSDIESVDAGHTDADLAMALQLAEILYYEFPEYAGEYLAHWLRTQVERELLTRGSR